MAVSYSVQGSTGAVELHVDDPGGGYLNLIVWDSVSGRHDHTVSGNRLWTLLQDLTELACTEDAGWHDVPILGRLTPRDARDMLRSLQSAVLYATAGTDRAERTDDKTPQEPICIRCDVGSVWADRSPHANPWCVEHGHTPYGLPGITWEQAVRQHKEWEARRHA